MRQSANCLSMVQRVKRFFGRGLGGMLALVIASCTALTHQSQFMDARVDMRGQEASAGQIHYSLPRGLITFKVTRDSKGLVTIDPPALLIKADPLARYAVHLAESGFADDKYVISINSDGLLASSKSDNFDKSPEIIQKAVELFAEGSKAFISGRSGKATQATDSSLKPIFEEFIIDPFTTPQLRSRTGALITFHNIDKSPLPLLSSNEVVEAARRCQGSLCSRLLRPVQVTVRHGQTVQREYVLMVPDPILTISHDVTRSACVQRVTTLTFTAGVLATFDLSKPSEVLGCLNIPVAAIKTIVGIPSALLTFRTEQITSRNELISANTANLNALVSRMEAQSHFLAAVAARTPVVEAAPQARTGFNTDVQIVTKAQAERAINENDRWKERNDRCDRVHADALSKAEECKRKYESCFGEKSHHGLCLKQL